MDTEFKALILNNTWTLVAKPPNANVVETRWVFDLKDEIPPRYKARLVVKGYSQIHGVDYNETYAPVVKAETLRLLFAIAAMMRYDCHLMDAVTAFLNSILKDTIYVRQPEGYEDPEHPELVCLLNKALYGLKQSALEWYSTLREVLESEELGFKRIDADHAVFIARTGLSTTYLALFVDDIAIFGDDEQFISSTKRKLSARFRMKDLGIMKRFLGLDISRNSKGDVILSQEHYLERVLHRFGMQDAKPAPTPMPSNFKQRKRDYDPNNVEPEADQELYREIIGSLNHAAVWTRPDISNSVSRLAQYLHDPSINHMAAAKHLLRYIRGTTDFKQVYSASYQPQLIGYADADWANDEDDRKSYSGYCFFISACSTPFSYSSKKQTLVAQSTNESETIALSMAAKEALWLRSLCRDLDVFGRNGRITTPTLYTDSDSALKAIRNPVFHARTKHFDVRHHFIRETAINGDIVVGFVPGDENPADIFTKSLERVKHDKALQFIHMNQKQLQGS